MRRLNSEVKELKMAALQFHFDQSVGIEPINRLLLAVAAYAERVERCNSSIIIDGKLYTKSKKNSA